MGNGWVPSSPCAPPTVYLPLSGGTMTGSLILAADPIQPLEAATRQYVDAHVATAMGLGDNRLINGDMRIDQRNNGASGTATGVYTVDRWVYGASQAGKGTWTRGAAGASLVSLGFGYILQFTSSSAYTPAAGENFQFQQSIEADMVSDFAWGTPNAQPVTLSFLAVSSLAGTFSGSITNYAATRSYPFTIHGISRRLYESLCHHPRRHDRNLGDERQRRGADRSF